MNAIRASIGCYIVLIGGTVGLAIPPAATAPVRAAVSADRAGDAAVQSLIDRVLNQVTGSRRRLSTELASVPDADRGLREFLSRSATLGPPRSASNGTTIREASLDAALVNEFLSQLAARDPYRLDARRLRLPGSATAIRGAGSVQPTEGPFVDQPGWRHCSASTMSLVRSAAAEDLRLNLLVALSELRTGANQSLGELLTQDEPARQRLREAMARLPLPDPVLEPYGVCRLRLVLTRRLTLALLEPVLRGEGSAPDWSRLTAGVPVTIAIDGFAVSPPPPPRSATSASMPAE